MPDESLQTISATEVSALFNASPWTTKWMVYQRFRGVNVEKPADARMKWGSLLEPIILAQAAEELRLEVRPNRLPDGSQKYFRRGLLGCHRDGDIHCPDRGPGAIEAKAVFDYARWQQEWAGGKKPPKHVEIQTQCQMLVGDGTTSFNWGVIPAWCGGEITYFERKPIPELWAAMEVEAAKFFEDFRAGREPEPFGDPVEAPLISKVYPLVLAKTVDLSARADAHVLADSIRAMERYGADRLFAEKEEKRLKAMLKGIIKDAETAHFADGIVIRQKQVNRKGFEVKPSSYTTLDVYIPEGVMTGGPQPETKPTVNVLDAG